MKKTASVKTRITIWYTLLMFVLTIFVLILVSILSYRLSIDNIEKDITLQVTQISEKIAKHRINVFETVDNEKEFRNVSLYERSGKYICGQYVYDVASIEFKPGTARKETINGTSYIVYDVLCHGIPGEHGGFWIRGVESLSSTMFLKNSAIVIILVTIPVILLLTALGGYYITKKAFLPINGIINTANNISVQNDITERITIPHEAKKDELYNLSLTLNKMLDKIEILINREKQFTSDASHELRTPVSVILAQGEYMLDIAENDKQKELAQNIVDKAKQVSKLISRLLLLSRIDQKRQKFIKEKVNIGVLADIAADNLKNAASEKNITIITDISEDIIIDADETLMLSVLTNLVSNGIKYGKQDGYVHISAFSNGDKVQIMVKDNGIGIKEEDADKIWTRFYRIDNVRNDEYGSCGLGLAMVKSITELHGGTVYVKSSVGHGSEFILSFNKINP